MPSFAPANTAGLRAAWARRKAAYPAPLKALAGAPEYEILELTISPSSETRTPNQAPPPPPRPPRPQARRPPPPQQRAAHPEPGRALLAAIPAQVSQALGAPVVGGGRRAGPVQMRLQCRLD